ncbi:MAG: 4-coumarate--CoA ligase family protein, partial [Rhodococcus sp. (in: high G+C Gram-positive bacteria)]
MSFTSPHPDVVIPESSLYDLLFGTLSDEELQRTAFRDRGSGTTVEYRDLVARIDAVAGALTAQGLTVGDVVGLHAPNS